MTFILPALLNFIRAAERWIYSSTPTPKTHVLYQELHPCAKTRKQAFQTLLRGCCDVLTHHTHTAEPIQPSPVCSRRARSVTETGIDRGRKRHENTDSEEQMCGRHETHGQLAGTVTRLGARCPTAELQLLTGPGLGRASAALPRQYRWG